MCDYASYKCTKKKINELIINDNKKGKEKKCIN